MDYTTVDMVKAALGSTEDTDDGLLEEYVARASRFIDRYVTGAVQAVDYFLAEDVVDEVLHGQVDVNGNLVCWPHKALVNSVAALAYRWTPSQSWSDADLSNLVIDGGSVTVWNGALRRGRPFVKISYNGGFAEGTAALPADLVEAATVLVARFYKEAKSGLGDAIGVAELGMLVYTKALPVRVVEMLSRFKRVTQW